VDVDGFHFNDKFPARTAFENVCILLKVFYSISWAGVLDDFQAFFIKFRRASSFGSLFFVLTQSFAFQDCGFKSEVLSVAFTTVKDAVKTANLLFSSSLCFDYD